MEPLQSKRTLGSGSAEAIGRWFCQSVASFEVSLVALWLDRGDGNFGTRIMWAIEVIARSKSLRDTDGTLNVVMTDEARSVTCALFGGWRMEVMR
jgi:hypothetical protein